MADLAGQFAVVTGAGSGIGQAIAQAVGRQGATVGLVGRTKAKLDTTAATFNNHGPRPVILHTDLSVDNQIDSLKAELEQRFGQVDVLVMCAGEIAHGPVESAPVADFDKLYRTNVRANYRLIQNLLPLLRKRPGQIVFINSSVGLSARPNVAQFSASQHALRALTDALRAEINPDGIRVLSVYPGRVATPRQEKLYAKQGSDYKPELLVQPEDIASVVLNALLLPRSAEVTEISIRPLAKSY
ncbi:MAG TPA: SDR family NAD(P)-dependent oxidoreductase [Candidatus Sulfotelmatobacter sp.]|nr:SDR family NAD(P)-dependent oxidoreductase [Candidatus Sulfotelmatobacter sp.]